MTPKEIDGASYKTLAVRISGIRDELRLIHSRLEDLVEESRICPTCKQETSSNHNDDADNLSYCVEEAADRLSEYV